MEITPESIQKEISEMKSRLETFETVLKNLPSQLPNPTVDLEKIDTWELVAQAYNEHPTESLPYPTPKYDDQENTNAFHQVKRIIKLFNNDPKFPDFNNSKQDKLAAAFDMRTSPGFGFSDSNYDCWCSGVGARLSWKEFNTMKRVCTIPGFIPIFKKFYN